MADWQMLMVCTCAHTEHISHQVTVLALICVLAGVLVHAVAESATVLQQQRLIFLTEICCCGLAEEDRGEEGQELERKEREAVFSIA